MRSALASFVLVVVLGEIALALVATGADERVAQPFGVAVKQAVAVLDPGKEACQQPIDLAADAEGFEFNPNSLTTHPPALDVIVRALPNNSVLAEGRLPPGWDSAKPQAVRF